MNADTEFQHRLEKMLDEKFSSGRDNLANGVCSNHPKPEIDYANRTGYLRALKDVGEMCVEISKQMHGKPEEHYMGESE